MGRVYFPTKNDIGVRTLSGDTLGGDNYEGFRAPAEPAPRGANNPVTLGAMVMTNGAGRPVGVDPVYWTGVIAYRPPVSSAPQPLPLAPVSALPQPVTAPAPPPAAAAPQPAAPVSQQNTPTPTVNIAPAPSPAPVLVTSGGGTASPAPAPVTSAPAVAAPAATSTDLTGQVASWLGSSTAIGSYSVPNALLAAAVVLGFAWLSSPSGKKR